MCSTTHASQAPVRLLRRSERLGKPPEGGVLPPFLRGESWVLETPLESLPGPPEGVLSPPDRARVPVYLPMLVGRAVGPGRSLLSEKATGRVARGACPVFQGLVRRVGR